MAFYMILMTVQEEVQGVFMDIGQNLINVFYLEFDHLHISLKKQNKKIIFYNNCKLIEDSSL